MLLQELKDITDIDGRIDDLHKQLLSLYERRSSIALPVDKKPYQDKTLNKSGSRLVTSELATLYENLSGSWRRYGIEIPKYGHISKRLAKATQLISNLSGSSANESYAIVLVPPSSSLSLTQLNNFRQIQMPPQSLDFISLGVPKQPQTTKWRVMVVLSSPEARPISSSDDLILPKLHLAEGNSSLQLGFWEYVSMTLQIDKVFDINKWTVLPKEWPQDGPIPCVRFIAGRYRFEVDDVNGAFGDNSFRPATIIEDTKD